MTIAENILLPALGTNKSLGIFRDITRIMSANMDNNEKDPAYLRHWKSWGSWHSWGSPVGIGIGWFLFIVGTGIFLYLLRQTEVIGTMML